MLITWGYFGTKLFWVLRQENFLTGYISGGFYCIQWHFKCAGSKQSNTESILMVNVTRCQWKHLWLYLKHCPKTCPQNIRKTPGMKTVAPQKYNELCRDIPLRDSKDCTGVLGSINTTMPSLRQAFSCHLFFFWFIYLYSYWFTYSFIHYMMLSVSHTAQYQMTGL